MAKTKINWILAQQDYLASKEISLTDISKRYGISLSRVKKVSMTQGWNATKNRVWEAARLAAIEVGIDSTKDVIKRHSKAARYLQETGLRLLKEYLRKTKVTDLSPHFLFRMIVLGLKAEKDLYPQELIIKYHRAKLEKEERLEDVSPELLKAVNEVLKMELCKKKPLSVVK
jgi:hypothetical protein